MMLKQIAIVVGLLLNCSIVFSSDNYFQEYKPYGEGITSVEIPSELQMENISMLRSIGGGGQDGFDDPGGGDNPGGYNDPAPVGNDWIVIPLLGIIYMIWKMRKIKMEYKLKYRQ